MTENDMQETKQAGRQTDRQSARYRQVSSETNSITKVQINSMRCEISFQPE